MLTCNQARRLLSDYIDGELDAERSSQVDAHLETCQSCPPLAKATIAVLAELRKPDDASIRDDLIEQILALVGVTTPATPTERDPK